jgi:prepilin-type processing-associated H-X9-DG protein
MKEARIDSGMVGSAYTPLLADGGPSSPLYYPIGGGTTSVLSFTPGPVRKTTLSPPQFSVGTPSDGPTGWVATWTNQTLQDYRGFAPIHRRVCNIVFADGSVRSYEDHNQDGYVNNGFPAGNGFRDSTVELSQTEVNSLYSTSVRLTTP